MATHSDRRYSTGLKVIDVASWIAGPVAATILADYGADVDQGGNAGCRRRLSRVGRGARHAGRPTINYTWMMDARNKRSLTLNLKDPRGKAILLRLVAELRRLRHQSADADAPRARPHVTPTSRAINPRMIYASLTAYGEDGTGARPRRIRSRRVLGANRPDGSGANRRRRTGAVVAGDGRSPDAPSRCTPRSSPRCCGANAPGAAAKYIRRCLPTGSGRRLRRASQTRRRGFFGVATPGRIGMTRPMYRAADGTLVAIHDGANADRNRRAASAPRSRPTYSPTRDSRRRKRASKTASNWSSACATPSRAQSSSEWLAAFQTAKVPARARGHVGRSAH